MRILFSSHVYAPSIGGLESVSAVLAEEFVRRGHEVKLITQTPGKDDGTAAFEIWRRPSPARLFQLVRWCDLCFHNNISLPRAWPLLLLRRPWVVAHHVWIPRRGLAARAKRLALGRAVGISVSTAVADHLSTPSTVIPNPYDDRLFREIPDVARNRDIVFLGRLVSDKGADLLVDAVARLKSAGFDPTVTIVGSGPEERTLRGRVRGLGLQDQVAFTGPMRGNELVRVLNGHRLIAIPSRWEEPFGVVALEGMACGCVPVGSSGGGLGEAIGGCGETFPRGDAVALADVLGRLLRDPARLLEFRHRMPEYLRRHTAASVAARYLQVFDDALRTRGAGRRDHARPDHV
jgi:glycosyltransferase involved in cell wall biosynthesis